MSVISAHAIIFTHDAKAIISKTTKTIDLDTVDSSGADIQATFFNPDGFKWAEFRKAEADALSVPYNFDEFDVDGVDYNNDNSILNVYKEALGNSDLDCYDECSLVDYHKDMANVQGLADLCDIKCFLSLDEYQKSVESLGWDKSEDSLIFVVGVLFKNPRPELPDVMVNMRYSLNNDESKALFSIS